MDWVILLTVTVCVSLTEYQLVSPARVTCTEHVIPPRDEVRLTPLSVHVPDWSDHVTVPVDWPPAVARVSVEPVVNEPALVIEKPVWFALSTVTVVLADCLANQLPSCALVARTTQVEPASPGVTTAPLTVHVLPVAGTTAHVTDPEPDPPDAVSVRSCPYVADVEVTVSVDWVARETVTVKFAESTGR